MSTAQAWPFIVTRNATLDWRPILAPPFLIDAKADYLLVTETSGPSPELTQPSMNVVESAGAGTITVVFSSIQATTEMLGRQPAEPLVDRFGRPIHVVEGLVLRGAQGPSPSDLQSTLDRVRDETLRLLPAFWDEEDEAAPPARSRPMPITVITAKATAAPPHDEQQGPKTTSRMALPLILIGVLAFVAATWWWRARARG